MSQRRGPSWFLGLGCGLAVLAWPLRRQLVQPRFVLPALGGLAAIGLALASSPYVRQVVRSRVTLWPSEALAARNLVAFASELGSRCELRYGGTSVSRLSVPLSGGARALGLRVVVRSRSAHTGEIGYHDIIAFVCGRAEIALTAALSNGHSGD